MAARPQWYFSSIGLTNRVQPYCRLAIITMQTMPKISWPQRVASEACARASTDSVAAVISYPRWSCPCGPAHRSCTSEPQQPRAVIRHQVTTLFTVNHSNQKLIHPVQRVAAFSYDSDT